MGMRDSMFSVFRMNPDASTRGLWDVDGLKYRTGATEHRKFDFSNVRMFGCSLIFECSHVQCSNVLYIFS